MTSLPSMYHEMAIAKNKGPKTLNLKTVWASAGSRMRNPVGIKDATVSTMPNCVHSTSMTKVSIGKRRTQLFMPQQMTVFTGQKLVTSPENDADQ